MPLSRANAPNRRGGGRGSLSSDRMFRITVKKALKVGTPGHRSFIRRADRSATLGCDRGSTSGEAIENRCLTVDANWLPYTYGLGRRPADAVGEE